MRGLAVFDRAVRTPRGPTRPRRVLVVDDNPEAADTLASALRYLGYEVRVKYDGLDGLEEAETYLPDVAIWDVMMPRLDGHEAARRLREQTGGRRIMLVALTALRGDGTRQLSLAAGFDAHLLKPLDFNQLVETLGCA